MMEGKCTIFFENPFWVAVFERYDEKGYSFARHVFGAEPGEAELNVFAKEAHARLVFSPPGPPPVRKAQPDNFKRRCREAHKQVQAGLGTFAQRAMQAEYERRKETQQEDSRARREELAAQKFLARQARKKDKKRGR